MAEKKTLHDRNLTALKPAPKGKLYDRWDSVVPGFGVRVSDTGRKTFVLVARFPGSRHPTRRAIGEYGAITLDKARQEARDWLGLIRQGRDPKDENERKRTAEQRKRANSFRSVAEDFIAEKLPKERKGAEIERDIRGNFIELWGGRPVTDVTEEDVAVVIKQKARTAPSQARNLLGTAKRLFQWAIDQRAYGIRISPAAPLKPSALCGEKTARNRKLSDDEVIAFWRTAKRMAYPYGHIYQLLVLTGLRLNEVADANWDEFNPRVVRALRQRKPDTRIDWSQFKRDELIWVIPAARMKGKESRARAHAVPLTAEILSILEAVPFYQSGDFLFSTTYGQKPVWVSDKIKDKLDARMLRTLQAMAKMRGDNPQKVKLDHWQNHDLRRVVRSGFSRLKISNEVAEAVIAHARKGIEGTYDVHDYFDEKREALELWAGRLRDLIEPPPPNMVKLETARAQ